MLAGFLILIAEYVQQSRPLLVSGLARIRSVRWVSYFLLTYGAILLGNLGAKQFIYFQF